MLNYLYTLYAVARRDDERGATAVEYGLMVVLIGMAIVGTVFLLGTELSDLFGGVGDEINSPDGS